jgi:hypothetical protein
MSKPLIGSMLAVAGAVALALVSAAWIPAAALAQDAEGARGGRGARPREPGGPVPRTPDGKPDLRGRWDPAAFTASNILEEHPGGFGVQAGKSVITDPPDGKIPYQPWALKQRDENRKPENGYLDNEGKCFRAGVPRIMLFAMEIIYIPDNIVLLYDYVKHTRTISMTRRTHLPESIKLWMGDPLGHWEGDTLVVESTNFNGKAWFALGGDFMTDAGSVVERFKMTDSNTLTWNATLTDPKAYTRPWTMTTSAPFIRQPAEEMLEDTCHEGNADLDNLKNVYDMTHGKK